MKVKEHYDQHLGNFYAWMVAILRRRKKHKKTFSFQNGLSLKSNKVAFDLGAGNGLQTFALANLGYIVKAVYFNKQLLQELSLRTENTDVEIVEEWFQPDIGVPLKNLVCHSDLSDRT